jgi:hypothetical protein
MLLSFIVSEGGQNLLIAENIRMQEILRIAGIFRA